MTQRFWNSNFVEPKRSFRFLFELIPNNAPEGIASYYVRTAGVPKFQMDGQGEVKYVQHTFKYPGRITWQPISVTLLDPATPDAAGIMMNILRESGYEKPATVASSQRSISKVGANNAMGTVFLRQIDANGMTHSEWTLWNPFLISVDFGQHGYDSDDLVEYSLEIDYDYATYKTYNSETTVHPEVSH